MAPQVVVVIPFYGTTLEYLNESIASALSIPSVSRVVVADDCSPASPAESERVTVVRRETNNGPAGALNTGIATLDRDDIVCRLDVRDLFHPVKQAQIETAQAASFSWTFDPVNNCVRKPHPKWRSRILTDNQFSGSGQVFTVEAWRSVGGFDESLRWGSDWDFAIRMERAVGWTEFPHVTAIHGEHPGGHSDVTASKALAKLRDADLIRVREFARSLR